MPDRRIIFFIRFHNYNSQGLKRLYRYFLNFYARQRCLDHSFESWEPVSGRAVCYNVTGILLGRQPVVVLDFHFADILLYGKSPLLFALIFAKIVKKSKNINDAERIVCYNKGGQKGAG